MGEGGLRMAELWSAGRWRLLCVVVIVVVLGLNAAPTTAQGAPGSEYYVDSVNGSDSNPGTSPDAPWRTLTPVRAHNFLPGDVVHFKRGSSWTISGERRGFIIDDSGVEGNPITFTAYGTGARPIFRNPGSDDYFTHGITIDGSWIVLEGILVRDTWREGIYVSRNANHNVIKDVEVTSAGTGVGLYGQYNLVTQSFFHDLTMIVNTPGGNDDFGAVGVWLYDSYNEVSYNRMVRCIAPSYDYGVDGGVVEFWGNVNNCYIHHNWGEECDGAFEVASGSGDDCLNNTIAYNVFVNNTCIGGFHLEGGFAANVENFRLENNTFIDVSGGDIGYVAIWFGGTPSANTLIMRNNIIYMDKHYSVAGAGKGGFTHEHNLYYFTNPQTSLGYEPGAGEEVADPMFVDLPGQDFHLQLESPAIDAGTNLGYSLDFDDRPVPAGTAPDIGAYEYGAGGGGTEPTATPTPAPPTATPTNTPMPTNTPTANPNELIIDNGDSRFFTSSSQDAWHAYVEVGGQHYGGSHLYNTQIGTGQDTATWSFTVPKAGRYEVYAWWWEGNWRPTDVPYTIHHFGGSETVRVSQRTNGGRWNLLGTFEFEGQGSVVVSDDASSGQDVVADAVRLVYLGPLSSATHTATPTESPTSTPTVTAVPPTATLTPTNTPTNMPTPAPPTATPSNTPIPTNTPAANANELIIDNPDSRFSTNSSQDAWQEYAAVGGQHYGDTHYYNRQIGTGGDTATWSFTVPRPGRYVVYAWWWEGFWRPPDVPYTIYHLGGSTTVRLSQRVNGGRWNLLGAFDFRTDGSIGLSDDVSSGQDVVADAVRLVYLGSSPSGTPTSTPTATPTSVPTKMPTNTVAATPRHVATNTPTPTSEPEPRPPKTPKPPKPKPTRRPTKTPRSRDRSRADANSDNVVDLFDLVLITSAYNPSGPVSNPAADINGDGVVNLFDLVLVTASYGLRYW